MTPKTGPYKILLATTLLQRGGVESMRQLLAQDLAAKGHHVVIVSLGDEGPIGARLGDLGFTVHHLDGPPFYRPRIVLGLARLIRSIQPDIVHSSCIEANVVSALACRLGGHTPHVAEEVGVPLGRSRLARLVDTVALRSAGAVVAHSRDVKTYLVDVEHVPGPSISIYPPVADLSRFQAVDPAARQRNLVLSLGRLDAVKGHDVLLRAVALLSARHDSLRVRILGAGPEGENLSNLARDLGIADKVELPGAVDDAAQHLRYPGCFVLPSRTEGSSVALVEALAAGCAVVATRVGGVTRLVQDGANGFIVPPEDPRALADAIDTVVTMPAREYERLSQAARESVRGFGPDAFTRTAVTAYEAVLGG